MRPNRIIYIISFLTVFISNCKKDSITSNSVDVYVKGIVIDTYTKNPLSGMAVIANVSRSGWSSPAFTILDSTTTDSNGEFTLHVGIIFPDATRYGLESGYTGVFDTTKLGCKYWGNGVYLKPNLSDLIKYQTLELLPAGYITTYISDSTWKNLPAYTVIVSSPFTSDTLFRGQPRIYFNVEASQLNTFSWFYIKNRIKGSTVTKQIYVPNYTKMDGSSSVLFYEITF